MRSMDWKDMLAEIQEYSVANMRETRCTGCRLITLNADKSLMSSGYTTKSRLLYNALNFSALGPPKCMSSKMRCGPKHVCKGACDDTF